MIKKVTATVLAKREYETHLIDPPTTFYDIEYTIEYLFNIKKTKVFSTTVYNRAEDSDFWFCNKQMVQPWLQDALIEAVFNFTIDGMNYEMDKVIKETNKLLNK